MKKSYNFKNFLKVHYRRIILYAVNIIAFTLLMIWAMVAYKLNGGYGYQEMGQIVPCIIIYIIFACFSLIVYYLSIIASALTRAYKEKKEQVKPNGKYGD